MYADTISRSMKEAIDETARRRQIQADYNREHGIVPRTIKKEITDILEKEDTKGKHSKKTEVQKTYDFSSVQERDRCLKALEKEMRIASKNLEFEKAIALRDEIDRIRSLPIFGE